MVVVIIALVIVIVIALVIALVIVVVVVVVVVVLTLAIVVARGLEEAAEAEAVPLAGLDANISLPLTTITSLLLTTIMQTCLYYLLNANISLLLLNANISLLLTTRIQLPGKAPECCAWDAAARS